VDNLRRLSAFCARVGTVQAASATRRTKTSSSRNLIVGLVGVATVFALVRLAAGEVEVLGTAGSPAHVISPAATTERPTPAAAGSREQQRSPPTQREVWPLAQRQGSPTARHWQGVLDVLDRDRAKAWRQGRPALLRYVYLPSAAERLEDRSMLRAYARRGLHVQGVRLAFGSVEVVHRARGAVRLHVVDQLRTATAVDQQGRRVELPRDSPSRHTIVLRRFDGGWRIADVRVR
jgi:hypothetical protein